MKKKDTMDNTMNDQTPPSEIKKTNKRFEKIKVKNPTLLFLVITLILVFIVLFQQILEMKKTDQINETINNIMKDVETTHTLEQQTLQLLKQNMANISAIQANTNQLTEIINQNKQTYQSFETAITESLKQNTTITDQNSRLLKKITQLLEQNKPQTSEASSILSLTSIPKGFQKTDQYRISGIAPYGVILQDKKGNFIIAQINKKLDIGTISIITKRYVIAGDYIITEDNI